MERNDMTPQEIQMFEIENYSRLQRIKKANGEKQNETLDYESVRFSYADGYRAVQNLLARGRKFTALFAMADVMAIGAIRALRDAGLRVQEDVSVMGFDGLEIGGYTVPRLATVSQSIEELADHSIQMLQENIARKQPGRYETVPVRVELRESARRVK